MKVLHVVAYMSPDGSYGGPTSVAMAQARALVSRGHAVTLVAGAPIRRDTLQIIDGVRVQLYPARFLGKDGKFAFLTSWRLIWAVAMSRFDVAHFHLSRDLTVLPAALFAAWRRASYVVQPHGMITTSPKRSAAILDRLATKRVLRGSSVVLCLTTQETHEIETLEPQVSTASIVNGVEIKPIPSYSGRAKRIVFLSRLHERKRPVAFVGMSARLQARWPDVEFILYGPDEGEGSAVIAACDAARAGGRIRWDGPVRPEDVPQLLAESLAFVLPSYGEVFPMAMLEAFQAGTPVVATDSLGIADPCRRYGAALITDGSIESLAAAAETILGSAERAEHLRQGAYSYLRSALDITKVAQQLGEHYSRALDRQARIHLGNRASKLEEVGRNE